MMEKEVDGSSPLRKMSLWNQSQRQKRSACLLLQQNSSVGQTTKNWLRSLSDTKDNHWLKLQSSQLTWFCLRVVVKTQQRTRIFQSIVYSPRRRRRANKQHGHLSNDLRHSVEPWAYMLYSTALARRSTTRRRIDRDSL